MEKSHFQWTNFWGAGHNDFTPDAVLAHSTGQPVVLLMTGADLMAVLEGRIDFVSLLLRKRRHAAQTGNILLRIHEIIQG